MELKEIQDQLDNFIAKNVDVIINDIMLYQPLRYEIHNEYICFYRENKRLAMIHRMAIRDIY